MADILSTTGFLAFGCVEYDKIKMLGRHSTLVSACQYVSSTAPTVRPIRKAPLVLVYDPLDNREIAFGVAHFALRRFPRWCVPLTGSVLPTHARAIKFSRPD